MGRETQLSFCIGTYDSNDETCNGDFSKVFNPDEPPCFWRDRCSAFTKYLKKSDKKPTVFLVIDKDTELAEPLMGLNRFKRFCDNLIRRQSKKKRRKVKKKDRRLRGPTPEAKQAATEALIKRAIKRRNILLGMFNEFKRVFLRRLGQNRKMVVPLAGRVTPVGSFYIKNHLRSNRYISIYCRSLELDIPIIKCLFKTNSLTFDVCLPMTPKQIEENTPKYTLKKLGEIKPIRYGRFYSVTKKVDKERLSIIAELLAKMIRKEKIELPQSK